MLREVVREHAGPVPEQGCEGALGHYPAFRDGHQPQCWSTRRIFSEHAGSGGWGRLGMWHSCPPGWPVPWHCPRAMHPTSPPCAEKSLRSDPSILEGAWERGQSLVLACGGTGRVQSIALWCSCISPCCFACALPLAKGLGCRCSGDPIGVQAHRGLAG